MVRITKTLLDSWLYSFKKEGGYEDFLSTLNREKKPPTMQMLEGLRYENVLNSILNGEPLLQDNEWFYPLAEMACELQGAQQQVVLFSEIDVDGQKILLHGVLDYLRESRIWDCKYTKRYELNKYHWDKTSQTAMYLALVPEAFDFTYIVSDGKYVYRERYPRDVVPPIEDTIRMFLSYLDKHNLFEIYERNWKVNV